MKRADFDSILIVSFGGPEGPEDVMPFLRNVTSGRNIPEERLLEVAEHYHHFDGKSPINAQNRELIAALESELKARDIKLPVYFGNRNWTPFLGEALTEMKEHGHQNALAFFTSMFSCYSGCRQYRENICDAQSEVGGDAPKVSKLRMGFNHPRFIAAMSGRVTEKLEEFPEALRSQAELIFTAHSIPNSMAAGSDYELQLKESASLVANAVGVEKHTLCYQSRSGPPQVPWLEPDICDLLEERAEKGDRTPVVVVPLGFISDHIEVLYDLDDEAKETAEKHDIPFKRAGTVGTHPEFVSMICDLIEERLYDKSDKPALGTLGAWHDVCPENCCEYKPVRPRPPAS